MLEGQYFSLCVQTEGSSPDAKIRYVSWFGRPSQVPGTGRFGFLCPLESIELPALHRRHFGGLPTALNQEALPRSSLVSATELCAVSRFQDHPLPNSE